MALHRTIESRDQAIEDVHSIGPSQRSLPKYRLPAHPTAASAACHLVRDELLLDGNSRRNLATFCTTWVAPEVQKLMADALDRNMIDKDEYPQTAEIENRCVHIIADLWHAPTSWNTADCSTAGSSEAAMLGGLALKWRWKASARRPACRPTSPISSAVRCGSAGRNSRAVSTSKSAKCRCAAMRSACSPATCGATATRTPSAWWPRWASRSPASTSPSPRSRRQCVPIRHGVSRDLIALLLDDLKRGIEYLKLNPVRQSNAGPTFSHGVVAGLPAA